MRTPHQFLQRIAIKESIFNTMYQSMIHQGYIIVLGPEEFSLELISTRGRDIRCVDPYGAGAGEFGSGDQSANSRKRKVIELGAALLDSFCGCAQT